MAANLECNVDPVRGQIMAEGDSYIPRSPAGMAVNELLRIVLDGKVQMRSDAFKDMMASKTNVIRAVDQSTELQHMVEQLIFRMANLISDQDFE